MLGNTISFFGPKLYGAMVTEQTSGTFYLEHIDFMYRGKTHGNFCVFSIQSTLLRLTVDEKKTLFASKITCVCCVHENLMEIFN